ncbi:MAG TPA: glutaminase A, partial [Candidatus Binatia bacterium]|nr:glutaminase A [Candidatus Binatia bacterium]
MSLRSGSLPERPALDDPVASPIQSYLDQLHRRHAAARDGAVATYIPELAKADPDWFGISIATTDGKVYAAGDTSQSFTIQSISKPFTYGLALEDVGRDAVHKKIGVEPTGDAFNSISLERGSGRPLNPMINAGAIAAASLVAGHSQHDKFHRLLSVYSLYAGRDLSLDRAVYESEKQTGHRNRAIAHMLRNFDILTGDPEAPLDLYFRQCSIAVDSRDLSIMAATLANGGVNPLTGERAIRRDFVEHLLSVMTTCGMYDYAGEWLYWVGLPAKSGVAGGLLAVLPGQLGIGIFSPPLDARGNSVRAVRACKDLSRDFQLHFLRVPRSAGFGLRRQSSLAQLSSKRVRDERERRHLDAIGDRVRVYDLQGDLVFSVIEALIGRILEAKPPLRFAIVDLRRVTRIDEWVAGLFARLVLELACSGRGVIFVDAGRLRRFLRQLEEQLATADRQERLLAFSDLDAAVEWCENRLLAESGMGPPSKAITLSAHGLCRGLSPEAVGELESVLVKRSFAPGELIIRSGEPADRLFLLVRGEV